MTLGEKLRDAREAKGLTQAELSEKSGISKNAIGLYERDQSEPSFFTMTCIAKALGISLDYLAGLKPEGRPSGIALSGDLRRRRDD